MIQEAASEVLNKNILDMRAVMIRKFQEKGYPVKDPKHAAALANPLQGFFDVVTSTKNEFSESTDGDGDADAEKASDTAEKTTDTTDAPADAPAEKAPEKPADKKEAEDFAD